MNLSVAALEVLVAKGLSAADILDVARALDVRSDPTAAERMRRHRAKKAENVTVTRNVTPVTADAPPNDIYSNPPSLPVEAKASTSPFAEKVVSEWNDGPAKRGARKAQKLDPARRKQLAARVREFGEDGVLAAIRGITASDWHCGIGSNGWRANLGWLIEKPKHVSDAIERADEAPAANAKPMTDEDMAAFRASLADKPWMRGREGELGQPPPRNPAHASRGPVPIGDLASRIAGHAS